MLDIILPTDPTDRYCHFYIPTNAKRRHFGTVVLCDAVPVRPQGQLIPYPATVLYFQHPFLDWHQ